MNLKTLLFEVHDNIAHVTLNRPRSANTINLEMSKELMNVAMRCDEDRMIRALLISGAGPIFCGGGDVKSFANQNDKLPHHLKEITTHLHVAVSYLARMDPPVVAAVHGSAAGAGLSLVCACDLVLAAETARFTLAYSKIGLTPDGGATFTLTRLVGLKRTLELALTNRLLSAKEACDWGIVTKVVPDKDLITNAKALAGQLAQGPTKAFGATKRLLQSGLVEAFESQMKKESRCISEMGRTADACEGISAFLGKRSAKFMGK